MSSSQWYDTFCYLCLCCLHDFELQLPSVMMPHGAEVLLSSTCMILL